MKRGKRHLLTRRRNIRYLICKFGFRFGVDSVMAGEKDSGQWSLEIFLAGIQNFNYVLSSQEHIPSTNDGGRCAIYEMPRRVNVSFASNPKIPNPNPFKLNCRTLKRSEIFFFFFFSKPTFPFIPSDRWRWIGFLHLKSTPVHSFPLKPPLYPTCDAEMVAQLLVQNAFPDVV
jgi:hypothetical protein